MLIFLCALLQDPILEPERPNTLVEGASLWLFPVDDGTGDLAVSAENTKSLLLGRLDPGASALRPAWREAASSQDAGGSNIADHWHIFAHDHHWLSFSNSAARRCTLIKLDRGFKRVGTWTVYEGPGMPTNDHFLVAEPEGVAVGIFRPGFGHRVFRFDRDGKSLGRIDVGGGRFAHGNGSSAIATPKGFRIVATETLNMAQQGGILLIDTDANWKPQSAKLVIDEDRKNVAMGVANPLATGHLAITARVCSNAYPRGTMPPPPPEDQKRLAPDDGAIVRWLLAPDGRILSRTELSEKGVRPHTALVGNRLITTWDGGGLHLRIDRIR